MADTRIETLPAVRRTHETTPPDDPADLLGFYEQVIDESVTVSETEQHRAWQALEEIKSLELWRLTHSSFAAYVEERWGIARRTAYRQIAWAREVRELAMAAEVLTAVGTRVPTSPSQRSVVEGRKRPPTGKSEAVDVKATETTRTTDRSTPTAETITTLPAKPRQLSLFDVPTDDLLEELRTRAGTVDAEERRTLARRLRALLATLTSPEASATPAPGHRCRCTVPTLSKSASTICAACHLPRRR